MANLKKQVLGKVSGAVGDIVFREMRGRNIVGLKPTSIKIPNDPESIARRARFGLAIRLATVIGSNSWLKAVWLPKTPAGLSVFNYLIKINYPFVTPETTGNFIMMVPGGGFPFSVEQAGKDGDYYQVVVQTIGENSGITPSVEVNIRSVSLIFLSEPAAENLPSYSMRLISSGSEVTTLTGQLTFNAALGSSDALLFDQYQVQKAYHILLTFDAEGNPVNYSSTLSE